MINYKTEFIKLRYSGFICYSCMPDILESLACYLLLFKVLLNFSLVSYQTKNGYIRKFVPPTIYVPRLWMRSAGERGERRCESRNTTTTTTTIYSFEKKSQVLLWWQKFFSETPKSHPPLSILFLSFVYLFVMHLIFILFS